MNTPDNFLGGKLALFFDKWKAFPTDNWVLEHVLGVKVGLENVNLPDRKEISFSETESRQIKDELDKLLLKKVIQKTKHVEGEVISNIFVRDKKDGTVRVILNLKEMNKLIEKTHFKMETLSAAISLMKQDCFFASIDLKDAYFSVNVRNAHRKFFRFRYQGILYEFTSLPQGYKESPRIFTKLLKPILGFLRSQGHRLVAYIDDTLLQGDTKQECLKNVNDTGKTFDELGFTVHPVKSVLNPTQSIQFLGFVLDSISMTVSVSDEKSRAVVDRIKDLLEKKQCSIRDFSKVLGCLVALDPGVWIGPLYWKRLEIEKIWWLRHRKFDFDGMMKLTNAVREDLLWWIENIQKYPSPVSHKAPSVVICTDASMTGWGAVRDSTKTGGMWTDEEKSKHINILELIAVFFGLKALCNDVYDKNVKVMTDNSTTVACLNKKGSTKPDCNDITRKIWLWCLEHNVYIVAAHIPGVENKIADEESRKDRCSGEWSLNTDVFKCVQTVFGPFYVDLFASRNNAKVNKYVAWKPDPGAWVIDAFSFEWTMEGLYCFPPFSLISRVLRKVDQDRATITLIVPLWRTQVWFPLLMRMLIHFPILIKETPSLLTQPGTGENFKNANLKLIACAISGDTSKTVTFLKELGKLSVNRGDLTQKSPTPPSLKSGSIFVLNGISIPWRQM